MEACGSAHFFARWLSSAGHHVTLLPVQYVRRCARRNKTDAADSLALLEAYRCENPRAVPFKTEPCQVIQLPQRSRQLGKVFAAP